MRILFVNSAEFLNSTIPEGIALLSAILKKDGHQAEVFDTVFLKPKGYLLSKQESKSKVSNAAISFHKPTPYSLEDLTANDPEVDIVEEFSRKIKEFDPSLIAVSTMSRNYRSSLDLINKAKPSCMVVFGGIHPTLDPEEVLSRNEVDFVCVGEGDRALLELCNSIEEGRDFTRVENLYVKLKKQGSKDIIRNRLGSFVDLDPLPPPDLSIFDSRHLFRPFLGNIYKGIFMSTARGCPRGCYYCVNPRLRSLFKECGRNFVRFQSPKAVARRVKALKKEYGIEWIKFSDDSFLLRPVKQLCELRDLLRPLNIMFGCSIDPATVTKEKIKILKEAGCVSVSIGIETGNEKIRKKVIGRHIGNFEIRRAISIIRDYGIKLSSFNIIGLPGEEKENVFETIRFNKELEIPDANVYILYPFPGSKIYEDYGVSLVEHDYTPMSDAYGVNLSKMSKDDLSYFLRAFNLYLVLPKSYWERIDEAKKDSNLYRELVKTAQDIVLAKQLI